MALTDLNIAEARNQLTKGDISAVDLVEAHISALDATRALNCFITETVEQALIHAKASDERRFHGEIGLMEGIPIGMKDLFCTEGILTTAASHILDGFTPPYESTVSQNLLAAGAVVLGKSNLDEFAMGSSNETSYYGPVVNPW